MLSQEEKDAIVAKMQFEKEVRGELFKEAPRKKPWFESQLTLLLIGGLITGILVPLFQFNQKSIEWKRQIRYENYSFKMKSMRDCLREFTVLESYNSQVYELAKPFLNGDSLTQNQFEYFKAVFRETQKKRFEQIAGITSLTPSFPNRSEIAAIFQAYVDASFLYVLEIEQFVVKSGEKSRAEEREKTLSFLDSKTLDLHELHEKMLKAMKQDLTSEEARYEKIFN